MPEEILLRETIGEGAVLLRCPLFVATTRFPIGNVAFGDVDAVLIKRADDLFVGDVIAKHAVDHVALNEGEAGDFTIADFLLRDEGRILESGSWILDT